MNLIPLIRQASGKIDTHITGKVLSYNKPDASIMVEPHDGGKPMKVRLKAFIDKNTFGVYLVPKVGSFVLIQFIDTDPNLPIVQNCLEVDKVIFEKHTFDYDNDEEDQEVDKRFQIEIGMEDTVKITNAQRIIYDKPTVDDKEKRFNVCIGKDLAGKEDTVTVKNANNLLFEKEEGVRLNIDKDDNITLDKAVNINLDATGDVNIVANTITLGDSSVEAMMKGNTFKTWWTKVEAWLNTHNHGHPQGPTTPPISGAVETFDTNILSTKHSVGT